MQEVYSKEEFETKLSDMVCIYHINHPFHI